MLVDWSSCVICLEDFPPHLLQSHENCNMVSASNPPLLLTLYQHLNTYKCLSKYIYGKDLDTYVIGSLVS